MSNPYWEKVSAIADRQRAKGIATYGQGIEMNPADAITRIEHLQEELVDALMYCEWIKDSVKDVAPVVHGRWETVHDGWGRCSNCHRMDEIHELATHCRFCGARMDGDGNA